MCDKLPGVEVPAARSSVGAFASIERLGACLKNSHDVAIFIYAARRRRRHGCQADGLGPRLQATAAPAVGGVIRWSGALGSFRPARSGRREAGVVALNQLLVLLSDLLEFYSLGLIHPHHLVNKSAGADADAAEQERMISFREGSASCILSWGGQSTRWRRQGDGWPRRGDGWPGDRGRGGRRKGRTDDRVARGGRRGGQPGVTLPHQLAAVVVAAAAVG